ncbi:phage tail protein [Citrobacter braakii]|uniref:phage tail-collar fiber domain-containing protein n=1 Tax=Citrobacter braakii TaxID=57706 RepID=UPI0039B6280E
MSQTTITLAFEQWKAQQGATGEPVLLDEFVFASVPELDPDAPIDRAEGLPPESQIVHRQDVSRKGVVNDNAVVHSVVLGADVGDFSFNWIGLINKASGTLAMIVHAPVQQKLKTKEGQQGNVLTRSFLMEYNGAQAETGINTPAETWQIDFTARMAGMDERQRLENVDIYGVAAFFGDGYLVGKTGNQFFVTQGTGYVAGLRTSLAENQNITVTTRPVKVWLDVSWTGTLTSSWRVQSKITVTEDLADYVQNGVQHYVFAVASIDVNGNITDLRPKGTLNEQLACDALKKHEQSRNHPDATTSEKGFTRLNSAADSASETEAATPKAVKIAMDNANARLAKERHGTDIPNPPLFVQNIGLKPTVDKAANAVQKSGDTMTGNLWLSESGISIRTTNGDSPNFSIFNIAAGAEANFDLMGAEARIFGKGSPSASYQTASFNLNDGTFSVPGALKAGTAAFHFDGNVYGTVWGGWLSNWLNNQLNARATVDWASQNFATYGWTTQNFVQEVSLGAEVFYDQTGGVFTWTFKAPQGCTMTGLMARYTGTNSAHNIGGLYYKPIQRYKNGIWVTISG